MNYGGNLDMNKLIIILLAISYTFNSQAILIFGSNGYERKIGEYTNYIKRAEDNLKKEYFDQAITDFLHAINILQELERYAIEDIKSNSPLRAYLAGKNFLSTQAIERPDQTAINDLQQIIAGNVLSISDAIENTRKKHKAKLEESKRKAETIKPLKPTGPEKKPEFKELTKEQKDKIIKELEEMIKPISEYKKLVLTQKSRIIEYIQETIADIKTTSKKDELILKKTELIRNLYDKLFKRINTNDPNANDKANDALTEFATEYNKLK